jgi:hypothetical protein
LWRRGTGVGRGEIIEHFGSDLTSVKHGGKDAYLRFMFMSPVLRNSPVVWCDLT